MGNPFVHIELQTGDLAKATTFYSKLFDWKLETGRHACSRRGHALHHDQRWQRNGGMFANTVPKVPTHWLAYVGVEDIVHPRKAR